MLDKIIERLLSCNVPTEEEINFLCTKATEIFIGEKNIVEVEGPVTICGDTHGQFHDLIEMFKIVGFPPHTKYVFLGDYVDRGYHSVETISLLLAYKIKFPDNVTLLRGNHESRQITKVYGFYDECLKKFGSSSSWVTFTDMFDYLPLSALINNEAFCCHGGLGPSFSTLDQLRAIDRIQDTPNSGLVGDLLWSDPGESIGFESSPRGAGFLFGKDITEDFNKRNGLEMICRAHQMVDNGFVWNHKNECVTIFTAPNYCYHCGNMAAVMDLNKNGSYEFTQFENSPTVSQNSSTYKIPDYFL